MRVSIYIFICLIFIAACKKEDPGPLHYFVLPADSDCAPVLLDSFPLAPGHIWIYDTGDTMTAVGDTIINGTQTTKFRVGQTINHVDHFLRNANDGLWNVTTLYAPALAHFESGATAYLYDMSASDSLQTSPLRLAKYPIVLNDTFSSGENNSGEYYRSKWIAFKRISTAAGTFDCAVLETQSGRAQSWYRYYSAKGLVREIAVVTFGSKVKEDPGFYYDVTDLVSVNF